MPLFLHQNLAILVGQRTIGLLDFKRAASKRTGETMSRVSSKTVVMDLGRTVPRNGSMIVGIRFGREALR